MTAKVNNPVGGCMCGAVRYETKGAPMSVVHCHCESCRRHTGAPVVTLAGYKADQVRFTKGERSIYQSSPSVARAFCGDCGTPLTWEADWEGDAMIELHISTFDNPSDLPPEMHIHHGERLAWFDTADTLPRYEVWDSDAEPYLHAPSIRHTPGSSDGGS